MQRHLVEEGVEKGIVTPTGLVAQGRGECFDYLLGERTIESAEKAEKKAAEMLLEAEGAVISVNGNVTALCADAVVELAKAVEANIEVNLFYWSDDRAKRIGEVLKAKGAKEVFGLDEESKEDIPGLDSARGRVDKRGIGRADVVLVALEDGDRTEALVKNGKKVIAIDLNPLSRTPRKATVSIIDNVTRALPNIIKFAKEGAVADGFDNQENLKEALKEIKVRLDELSH